MDPKEGLGAPGHGKRVADMFGRIARWYDFLNHFLSLGQDHYWRHRLARSARPGEKGLVLDLAAGTLDVSVELNRQYPEVRVAALDFALPMLKEGKRRKLAKGREKAIFPVQADGRNLPLPDGCVDAVTIAFGIRNILPREAAYSEVLRVLRPGGRFCVLEFGTGKRRVWKGLYNFYLHRLLPLVGKLVSGDSGAYKYLADTIAAFPDERSLASELLEAGFKRVFYLPMLSGIVFLHVAEKSSGRESERKAESEGAAEKDE